MIVWTLYRDEFVAFGEYNNEELQQMQKEGWRIASKVKLKHKPIKPKRRKRYVQGKVVGVNKNGIQVMQ
ncbi:hypothetical protein OCI51_27660 (plasmid) [Lysinibacillus capsici]|uniref:hypothetical protein n=1 Tax=Lysinibacillus capsici TaxID=2115968 RepID=UPI0021D9AF42|nr:hypothetical protein [Lysinibacillus capsici]UYB50415.1 hypothetical protein OCI51_27660 [Lysinibacillus capsici]